MCGVAMFSMHGCCCVMDLFFSAWPTCPRERGERERGFQGRVQLGSTQVLDCVRGARRAARGFRESRLMRMQM